MGKRGPRKGQGSARARELAEATKAVSEQAIIAALMAGPHTGLRSLAVAAGRNLGTVQRAVLRLQEKGVVERSNGWIALAGQAPASRSPPWLPELLTALEVPCTQVAVVHAMQASGWARSTTQHRLAAAVRLGAVRLVDGMYAAVPP